jgi:NADH-quinone oxidoreductase subunit N
MAITDLVALLPLVVLVVWTLVLLLVDLWIPEQRKGITALLAATGLAVSLGLTLSQVGRNQLAFNNMAVVDGFAVYLNILFLASGLVGIAIAYDYLKRMGIERGEYYVLLLFAISGMMLMAYAYDLIVVFLALELLSIPLYILAGFARPRLDSEEASLKYFLLGAFASGFVLYGVAMVFGATAQTNLPGILNSITTGSANAGLMLVGAGLLLIGFGFKVAAVPFHMWTPDVYQGAPTAVTGFMSVAAKAAGFTALLRVFVIIFPGYSTQLVPILWVLAGLTMLFGNIAAISQRNIKRMLAYSSISHAGYILMAFVSFGNKNVSGSVLGSALFYLMAYAVTSLGAWAVVTAVEKAEGKGLDLQDYAGLGKKYPYLAAAMLIFMLSFTGVPPTLGFWGKFYLFRTAVEGGNIGLAVIGLLASLISAYYYLRVVVVMYMQPGEPDAQREPWVNLAALVAAAATLLLGLIPGPLFAMAAQALLRLN